MGHLEASRAATAEPSTEKKRARKASEPRMQSALIFARFAAVMCKSHRQTSKMGLEAQNVTQSARNPGSTLQHNKTVINQHEENLRCKMQNGLIRVHQGMLLVGFHSSAL